MTRAKAKGRKESGPFVAIPHQCLHHPSYAGLSSSAVKLLIDLCGQYKGTNNGDLCAAFTLMEKRGWKSKATLQRAKNELLAAGWIVLTRQGGRNLPSLYAVTFKPIDECGGKLDRAASNIALNYWRVGCNPEGLVSGTEN